MKVAYLIAFRDFRDEEYFIPKEVLEKKGIKVETFSNEKGIALGSLGGEEEVRDFRNINPLDYKGIIIAGGKGAIKYLDIEEVYNLLGEFKNKGLLLSGICIAPLILSRAGLLKGVKATIWSDKMDKKTIEEIEREGAFYSPEGVVEDKGIITGKGPDQSKEFGEKIASFLTE